METTTPDQQPSKQPPAQDPSLANPSIQQVRAKLKHQSKGLGLSKLFLTDALAMFFALGPGLLTWYGAILYLHQIWSSDLFALGILFFPLTLVFPFLIWTRLFRLLIPKMRPGVFPLAFSKPFAAWYLTLCLGHGVRIFGLHSLMFTFYFTKYLYWRAMGAKIAYGINSSLFLTIADYPLITIGKQCSFGAYVHIACHTYLGDKLMLAPVTIEDNVYVGMSTIIGPKTVIGKGSWIGFSNRLLQDRLPENTKIDNFAWEYGNPEKQAQRGLQ